MRRQNAATLGIALLCPSCFGKRYRLRHPDYQGPCKPSKLAPVRHTPAARTEKTSPRQRTSKLKENSARPRMGENRKAKQNEETQIQPLGGYVRRVQGKINGAKKQNIQEINKIKSLRQKTHLAAMRTCNRGEKWQHGR